MKGRTAMQAVKERTGLAPEPVSIVARLRTRVASRVAVVAAAVITTIAGTIVPASAASTDLSGGAGATFFTSITDYFQDHVLAAVLTLFALTVGISMLMGWGKKAAKSK